MWEDELSLAQDIAIQVGKLLLEEQYGLSHVLSSIDKDIKLKADIESEKLIVDHITKNSNYPILSEESGFIDGKSVDEISVYWILDPLDGSLNYYRGVPMACISIALWKGKDALLGVVYDFNRDELFTRISGKPLYLNRQLVKLDTTTKPKSESIIATGFPSGRAYDDTSLLKFVKLVQEYKKVRLLGSAALSLAWVACGRFDAYSEEGIYIWDIAAGLALVEPDNFDLYKLKDSSHKYFILAERNI
jgi:myo-inositol-1(or 4)-monophosphatase